MPTPTKPMFPAVRGLTPKEARKMFFYESYEPESTHLCISPPRGYLFGPCFIVTARTNPGNSAISVRQSGRGAKKHFFLNYAPPPQPTTIKPSRGWLRVGDRKPRFVLFNADITRNKVLRKKGPTSDVLGGVSPVLVAHFTAEKRRLERRAPCALHRAPVGQGPSGPGWLAIGHKRGAA